MGGDAVGPVGALISGRPLLASAVLAIGTTALVATAIPDQRFADLSGPATRFAAALAVCLVLPAVIGAIAPRARLPRLVLAAALLGAGFSAGSAGSTLAAVLGYAAPVASFPVISIGVVAAGLLVLAAPLWRTEMMLAWHGLLATVLGSLGAATLSAHAPSTADPAMLVVIATAAGASLSPLIASGFARAFAQGASHARAVGQAAGGAASLIVFATLATAATVAILDGGARAAAPVSAAIGVLLVMVCVLVMAGGGLALRAPSERIAEAENRRRAALRPWLAAIRQRMAPASALAVIAVAAIGALVAGFELGAARSASALMAPGVVSVSAAIAFISLRSGMLLAGLFATASLLATAVFAVFGASEGVGVVAGLLAGFSFGQLVVTWRDARAPRRKPREVSLATLLDSASSFAASAVCVVLVLLAAHGSGFWAPALDVLARYLVLCAIAAALVPAYLTSAAMIAVSARH